MTKMKKAKIITIIVLVVAVCALCGFCSYRCSHWNIDYRSKANKELKINIPEEWECVYYNRGTTYGFDGDGTEYYVFKTTERDDKFFKDFSATKNADFESAVNDRKAVSFDGYSPIDSEYLYDLSKPYEWYQKGLRVPLDELVTRVRVARMIYQSQRLYIFVTHTSDDPTPDELESLSSSERKLPYKKVC